VSKQFQVITNIVIGILAFIFIVVIGMTAFMVSDELKPYTASEDSMIYSLQDNRYSDLVRCYHKNMALDVKPTKTMEECYAVARYYEAAIDYQLAVQEKDSTLQKKAEELMAEAEKEMGDFSYAKGEIDELLNFKK